MSLAKYKKLVETFLGVRISRQRERVVRMSDFISASCVDSGEARFLNLGGADFSFPCWTNLDMPSQQYKERQSGNVSVPWDLNDGRSYPFPDNYFDAILCTQVCEHLPLTSLEHMAHEALRLLRPGGVFRVSSPDADLYIRTLLNADRTFFAPMLEYYQERNRWRNQFRFNPAEVDLEQLFLNALFSQLGCLRTETPIPSSDVLADFQGDSQAALDKYESLCEYSYEAPQLHITYCNATRFGALFDRAGFGTAGVSGYCQSRSPILRYIESKKASYVHHNIYFEGRK